jgi:hypothetical protein
MEHDSLRRLTPIRVLALYTTAKVTGWLNLFVQTKAHFRAVSTRGEPNNTIPMTQSRRYLLWLSLITLVAAALRFYRIGVLPPGLWFDEAWISL